MEDDDFGLQRGDCTTTFRQAFEDLDVGGVVGKPVENTVHEGVMKCVDELPEVKWDVILKQTDEELVEGDCRKSQFEGVGETDP